MDYSQSHVMTNAEYLVIMHKKVMEKAIAEAIRETHRKEREENKAKKSTTYFNVDEWTFQHVTTKSVRADFEYNWFAAIIREAWQHLHEHLRASWVAQGLEIIPITRLSRFILAMGGKVISKGQTICLRSCCSALASFY